MKIAVVNDTVYPYFKGGAPKRVWEISRWLAQRGHSVHLFGMKYWDGEDVIIKDGVYLHGVCPVQELYVDGKRSIKQAIYFAYKLLGSLLKEDFDIIDCSNFPYFPCFSAKLHSLTKGSALVITWLEVWSNYWYRYLGWKGVFGKWIEKTVAYLTPTFIAISESTKRDLLALGVTREINVVPIGLDFERIRAADSVEDYSDLMFTGRLIRDKNVDLLIKSIGVIKEEVPSINCLIIGDGPERNNLEEMVRNLRLEDNVRFLGFLDHSEDIFSYMKSSKVFVLPSTREGFGMVAIEANACSLPVVTISHPQNAATELINHGKNGFLCDLCEQDMAQKIIMALERRQGLTKNCMEYANKYDWNRIVDMVECVYESALSTRTKK